jgi:hypothetical protein
LIGAIRKWIAVNPVTWLRDTRRMRALVRNVDLSVGRVADGPRILVVVTPWLGTAVPWFSIVFGLFLAYRGSRISFVIDDLRFGGHSIRHGFILRCVRSVLSAISQRYSVLALRDYRSGRPLNAIEQQVVQRLAYLNAVWALRGETNPAGRQRYIHLVAKQLGAGCAAIVGLLESGSYDVVLVPGGVYGSSGVWVELARGFGIRASTFDSGGRGVLMLAANGIAC